MAKNSSSTRAIRDNGGIAEICKPMQEIGGKRNDCGYDRDRWRFNGGIEDTRELSWDDIDMTTEVYVW